VILTDPDCLLSQNVTVTTVCKSWLLDGDWMVNFQHLIYNLGPAVCSYCNTHIQPYTTSSSIKENLCRLVLQNICLAPFDISVGWLQWYVLCLWLFNISISMVMFASYSILYDTDVSIWIIFLVALFFLEFFADEKNR